MQIGTHALAQPFSLLLRQPDASQSGMGPGVRRDDEYEDPLATHTHRPIRCVAARSVRPASHYRARRNHRAAGRVPSLAGAAARATRPRRRATCLAKQTFHAAAAARVRWPRAYRHVLRRTKPKPCRLGWRCGSLAGPGAQVTVATTPFAVRAPSS